MPPIERTAYYAQAPAAVVIGCGHLGMASARALGRRHPLVLVEIDGERLERSLEALHAEGYPAQGVRCDIASREDVQALGAELAKGPGVRVLAHVAALGSGDWRRIIAVNIGAVHLVAEAVRPALIRGAAAILVSSVGAYMTPPDPRLDALLDDPLSPACCDAVVEILGKEPTPLEAYCLAKRAMNRFAEKLAVAWGGEEVRVLSMSPGLLDSAMARRDSPPGRYERVRDVPLGRQGTVMEAANVLAFLASDEASFMNGFDVLVDGGMGAQIRPRFGG
jgi:NAD(P)-dependent dehydrogenase (short-subunit alcohol dehydrogenase family)